jgi:hypothetical protein
MQPETRQTLNAEARKNGRSFFGGRATPYPSHAEDFSISRQADAAARSPALRPYSSAEPQCCAPFNSEWPMLMRP